jgi:2-phosphosulfolactate phosphatase
MRIDVALLPGQAFDRARSVSVVVDVLRASSSIVTLLERGAARVVGAPDIHAAGALRERLPDHLLCGEKDGLPPPGFDYGNSPSEFSRLEFHGRSAILATSNGTRILAALAEAPAVIVGCLLNRTAAARAAVAMACERSLNIVVVCSAAYGGSTFVLEDALGAGAIVEAALSAEPSLVAGDAARFAAEAFAAAGPRIGEAVASAYHARELAEAGLGDDVAYCGRLDVSTVAPVLEVGDGGLLAMRAWG